MDLSAAFFKDAIERIVMAFLAAFVSALVLAQTSAFNLSTVHSAFIGGVAAALAAVKSLIASMIPGTVSPASIVKP